MVFLEKEVYCCCCCLLRSTRARASKNGENKEEKKRGKKKKKKKRSEEEGEETKHRLLENLFRSSLVFLFLSLSPSLIPSLVERRAGESRGAAKLILVRRESGK